MIIRGLILGTALLVSLPVAADNDLTRDAAIGGAIGGALGGAVGAEVGGREGAIIGSGVGAAAGTAIATDGHDDDDHAPGVVIEPLEVHAQSGHPVGHDQGKHCPPGQAKKGRC